MAEVNKNIDNVKTKKTELLQKTWVVCALALVCTFLWGSASPCIKLGYAFFRIPSGETWTQVLFAGMRFVLAGILTVLIGSLLQRKVLVPTTASAPSIVKLAIFQTILQYIFFYFAGVIVVSMNGQKIDMDLSLMGDGSLFLCALSYAVSSCLMKKYSKKDNPVMLSGYQFILGGIVMVLLGFGMGGRIPHVSVSALLMLFYLACISAVAYSLWGILLKYNPVSKVAIFGFTNPVFGVLLSAWWLGEGSAELGWNALLALILVCIGICIVNVKFEKQA